MFSELDVVALTHNIEKYGLSEGRRGTIVQLYKNGDMFAVEFIDNEGYTVALLDLTPKDIRPVWSKHLHKDLFYSDRPTSKNKDEKWNWADLKYLKPNQASEFTKKFDFKY